MMTTQESRLHKIILLQLCAVAALSQGQSCDVADIPLGVSVPVEEQVSPAKVPGDAVLGFRPQAPLSISTAKPTELVAQAADDGTIQLSWLDNSADEEAFTIRRYDAAAVWTDYATVPSDTTTFVDSAVQPKRTYCYKLVAYNSAHSLSSNQVCARALASAAPSLAGSASGDADDVVAPLRPSSLAVTASGGQMALSWADNSVDEEGFLVRRYNGKAGWQELGRVQADLTEFVDAEAIAGQSYCYQVAAFTSTAQSAYSPTGCAKLSAKATVVPKDPAIPPPDEPVLPVMLSGSIRTTTAGLPGVTLSVSGIATSFKTSADGTFTITLPHGWSGTVTPSLTGYSFEPTRHEFDNVLLDLSGNDFTAQEPIVIPPPVPGAYYVAPDGRTENDGTRERPWPTVDYALSRVGGGKTIILRNGRYGRFFLTSQYTGSSSKPTVIRAETKWGAHLTNASGPYHTIELSKGCDWVILDGLQVSNGYVGGTGIKTYGHFTTVRNCWIHHNPLQGVEAHDTIGTVLEWNLIEQNGVDSRYDHGVYADGSEHIYRYNIVRRNASHGMHLFARLTGSIVVGNICYDNPDRQILVNFPADEPDSAPNVIAHNTCSGGRIGVGVFGGPSKLPNAIINNICSLNTLSPVLLQWTNPTVWVDGNLLSRAPYLTEVPAAMLGTANTYAPDPGFRNSSMSDFALTSSSMAIGKGISYNSFFGPVSNLLGEHQSGTSADCGALQYQP